MPHYVYIIYSKTFDKYYKGSSHNPYQRLEVHNLGKSRWTSNFLPWEIVFIQSFATKKEALIRERKLKKYSKDQILDLVGTSINEFICKG